MKAVWRGRTRGNQPTVTPPRGLRRGRREMTKVRWIVVMILASAVPSFAQCNQYPLKPSLLPPCPTLMGQVSKTIDYARDFQKVSAEATAAVAAARQAYWKVFPDGPGVK